MRDLSRLGFNTLKRNEGLHRRRPVYESGIFCFELCLYGKIAAYIKADGVLICRVNKKEKSNSKFAADGKNLYQSHDVGTNRFHLACLAAEALACAVF